MPSCAPPPSTRRSTGGGPSTRRWREYQRTRDEHALPIYEFTTQLATLDPPPAEMQQLLAATAGNQAAMDAFVSVTAGTMSPREFFHPTTWPASSAAPRREEDLAARLVGWGPQGRGGERGEADPGLDLGGEAEHLPRRAGAGDDVTDVAEPISTAHDRLRVVPRRRRRRDGAGHVEEGVRVDRWRR